MISRVVLAHLLFLCVASVQASSLRRTSILVDGGVPFALQPEIKEATEALDAMQGQVSLAGEPLPSQEAPAASEVDVSTNMDPDYTDKIGGDKEIIQKLTDEVTGAAEDVTPSQSVARVAQSLEPAMLSAVSAYEPELKAALTQPEVDDDEAEVEEEIEEVARDLPVKLDAAVNFHKGIVDRLEDSEAEGEEPEDHTDVGGKVLDDSLGNVDKILSVNSEELMKSFVLGEMAKTKKELKEMITTSIDAAVQPINEKLASLLERQPHVDTVVVEEPAEVEGADEHGCNESLSALFATKWDENIGKCVVTKPEAFDGEAFDGTGPEVSDAADEDSAGATGAVEIVEAGPVEVISNAAAALDPAAGFLKNSV